VVDGVTHDGHDDPHVFGVEVQVELHDRDGSLLRSAEGPVAGSGGDLLEPLVQGADAVGGLGRLDGLSGDGVRRRLSVD
ncbi:hypothetical protein CN983_28550, partial [Bacillus cereus]